MARRPIFWALGVAAMAGYSAWDTATDLASLTDGAPAPGSSSAEEKAAGGSLSLPSDARGHFVARPLVDGQSLTMLVDTGASSVALTEADARLLGLRPERAAYAVPLQTANGVVRGAPVRLRQVRLGTVLIRDVEAVILPEGALRTSLLGTSFLKRLSGYEVRGGRMILRG